MNTFEVKTILDKYHVSIKKRYGQNFLCDKNILNNIIEQSKIKDNKTNIIEIGPGLGFLTSLIVEHAKKLVCYEIDNEFIDILNDRFKAYTNFKLINRDFLKVNLNEEINNEFNGEHIYIIANLPYYITTPILLKVLEETLLVDKMVVMMQKEVAQRLCGKPQTKDYNSLSVLIQYFTNVKILFNVSPNCFYPTPEVESSVVLIERKTHLDNPTINLAYFLSFNRAIFSQRRKTIVNNILTNFGKDIYNRTLIEQVLKDYDISENARAESLTVKQIVTLANVFYQISNK